MAQKVGFNPISDPFRQRKALQRSTNIAGRARRTILTATGLTNGGTLIAAELLSFTLAADFFKTPGDAIFMTFFGKFNEDSGTVLISILDEDGATLINTFSGGGGILGDDVSFYADCVFLLDADKVIRGAGRMVLDDFVSPNPTQVWVPDPGSAFNAKKITIFVTANAADADVVQVNYFQAEFSPAVIF